MRTKTGLKSLSVPSLNTTLLRFNSFKISFEFVKLSNLSLNSRSCDKNDSC